MFSFLVVVLLCYLLYDGIVKLVQHEGRFELVQWAMLALCVLYIPVIIYSAMRAFKQYNESKGKRAEEEEKQREELAERKRRFYLDDTEPEYTVTEDDIFDDEDGIDDEAFEAEVVDDDYADTEDAD